MERTMKGTIGVQVYGLWNGCCHMIWDYMTVSPPKNPIKITPLDNPRLRNLDCSSYSGYDLDPFLHFLLTIRSLSKRKCGRCLTYFYFHVYPCQQQTLTFTLTLREQQTRLRFRVEACSAMTQILC